MSSTHLSAVLTRNVTFGNLKTFVTALGAVLHPSGKILLVDSEGRNRHLQITDRDASRRIGGFLTADGVDTWLTYKPGIPEWGLELCFRCTQPYSTPFSVGELRQVLDASCAHFGTRPTVIKNRPVLDSGPIGPIPSDTAFDVNVFYGFDVASAIQKHTTPSPHDPDDETERSFLCWRCKVPKPASEYYARGYGYDAPGFESDPFYNILGNWVLGVKTCCSGCIDSMSHEPP
jgi:hypothetical protein